MSDPVPDRFPAIFIGHGSPMNTLATNAYTQAWRAFGESVPRPRAVLCVSAHWYTRGSGVAVTARPETIHDFYGFPRELSEFQYPAAGDPGLAARVREVLAPDEVAEDAQWGLDHGAWSVLAHVYPRADVPVVQLSIDATRPPRWHRDAGARLSVLREEGILIVASGNIVHNLSVMRLRDGVPPFDWAVRFNDRIREALLAGDDAPLVGYADAGADAERSVPTPEHFLPALYVCGARRPGEPTTIVCDGVEAGSISMLSFAVG